MSVGFRINGERLFSTGSHRCFCAGKCYTATNDDNNNKNNNKKNTNTWQTTAKTVNKSIEKPCGHVRVHRQTENLITAFRDFQSQTCEQIEVVKRQRQIEIGAER